MHVRHADVARDAAACAAIYAPYVLDTSISFEEVAPTDRQFAALIAETSARYPWLEALLGLLRRQCLHSACAGITLPNDASIGLHRGLGFEHVGTYRSIGWKLGAWRDVSWWQLQLAGGDAEAGGGAPPPEPLGPQRL